MALFYFHFLQEGERHTDEIGLDLPSAEAAYLEAVAAARGMGSELIAGGIDPGRCAFEIADASGTLLFAVAIAELFDRKGADRPSRNETTRRLTSDLEETHRRVVTAKAEMAVSLSRARSALDESWALLARLGSFHR